MPVPPSVELIVSAFTHAPVGMLINTLDGTVVEANPAFAAMFDYSRDELIGSNSLKLWRDPAARQALIEQIRRQGAAHAFPVPARRRDGRALDLSTTAQLMLIDDQPHLFQVVIDHTEKNRSIERAQEHERRFNEIARSIREVFWLISLDRRQMLYVSPSYEQVFGDSCESLMKSPGRWLDAIHPEDQARIRALMANPEPRAYEMEFRIVRPDGAVRWILDRVFVVKDQAGRPTSIGGVAEDVTDRRVLQQEFERAQRMESVGQLAGGVAHDFNNLLTVISTSAHYLKLETGALKPTYKELCEEIEQAVLRATALTRQLLAFSRQEVVTPVALDVNELVKSTEKMLRRLLGEDVEVLTVLGPGRLTVMADPGQLTQVLLNLAVNARDAMPEGGRLVIEASQVTLGAPAARRHLAAKPGEYARLSVTDTGCGMTPEVQAHIFEPFFSTKAPGKGTGLGLAVVFGVVEQAGGLIDVVSAPGAGATFHIYLPVCAVRDEDAAGARRVADAGAGSETLLLVEDDDAVRRAAARGLREHGYRVLEAANASLALESLASSHPIDMLITDVVMPGLDGRRLAEQATSRRPGLKTLFVSGYTDDAVVRYGVFQSEVEFLHKPFSPGSLARKVRQVLDGRRP